jgi:hypothetical protein
MSAFPGRPKGEKFIAIERVRKRRIANLKKLADLHGSWSELGRQCGQSATFLVALAGPNPRRSIGEVLARDLEARLQLPACWLDQTH